ncbi:hypothetical protein ABZ891_36905 [Streptomyces sp. NPDC047023]|uniref:hypothetical protein n=1 Tax=Streptomyces sp. NPDC047023 TaxID=3155139 RepID=UPI0033DE97BF
MTLAIVLALAGWGASQVGYEPPEAVDGLKPPSLGMAKAFAEICEPAAPLLLSMAVVVALVTWSRFALAAGPR